MLLNASGCLDALVAPDVARQLDGFVTKTITPLPREGNGPPRIAETGTRDAERDRPRQSRARALSLRHAAEAAGARAAALDLRRRLLRADYAETCAALDDVEAIELNLSCPNVDEAADSAAEIVAACRAATPLRIYAKLSAAHPDVAEVARAVADAGADGLSLINTLRGLALDPRTLEPVLARGTGGLSGPSLKPIALATVHACHAATRLPIVGMGGITTAQDAWSSSRVVHSTLLSERCSSRIRTPRNAFATSSMLSRSTTSRCALPPSLDTSLARW